MNIGAEIYGQAVLLNLKGELTEESVEALKQAVDHQLGSKDEIVDVVLNLEQVPFVDSAGLMFLLSLQDRLAERLGQVRLAKCDENIRKILEITRLEGVFELCDDTTEAVKVMH